MTRSGCSRRAANMAVIDHIGRKSGRAYQTPVMVFVSDETLWVVLNHGSDSDWVQNVLSADGAWAVHRGRRHRLSGPRLIAASETWLLPAALGADRPVLCATLERAVAHQRP